MFKVNYRIVDEISEIKSMTPELFDADYEHISGFFEIIFGERKEGSYYHENPIQHGEVGGEFIDWWFNCLLYVCNNLSNKKYVAFNEPEKINRWLVFKVIKQNVIINVAKSTLQCNNKRFISEAENNFEYTESTYCLVSLEEFKKEVMSKVNSFINELIDINPKLIRTKMVIEILEKLKF